MNNTALFLTIFVVLLVVAALKFAWSQLVARSRPSNYDGDEDDWDAVQQYGHSHDGGWGSAHHSDSSHSDSSHSDSSDGGGGGDSSD